jgi:hypothetical protein
VLTEPELEELVEAVPVLPRATGAHVDTDFILCILATVVDFQM